MQDSSLISAIWHDGVSAAEHPVRVGHFDGVLSILRPMKKNTPQGRGDASGADSPGGESTDGALATWDLSSVSVLSGSFSGVSFEPVRLRISPDQGQRLVLHDQAAIALMASWYAEPYRRRRRSTLTRWVQAAALAWTFCIAFYFAGPFLFSIAAECIPREWEEAVGQSTQDTVLQALTLVPGTRGVCPEGNAQPDLAALMRRLEKGAPTRGYTFHLTVLDADFVNAFALPGGYLVVSTGLIKSCAGPDELAGVLAHELTHVTERHGTSRIMRYYAWSGLLRMMGISDAATSTLALTAVTSSMDRDDERDADSLGSARLIGAGITPEGMAAFFARLEQEEQETSGLLSYMASHPGLAERKETIRALIKTHNGTGRVFTPALESSGWQRVRGLCSHP